VELIWHTVRKPKGRVERRHGVFQDRFVKALRLQSINSIEGGITSWRPSSWTN